MLRMRDGSARSLISSFVWAFLCWLVLTWSTETEQLVSGALLAGAVTAGNYGLGTVARPWAVLDPRRLVALMRLAGTSGGRLLVAGMSLSRVVWSGGSRPGSGLVAIGTDEHRDGGLATVGLLTSLTPDNQLVDLDRRRSVLLYHTLRVRPDRAEQRRALTGSVEHAISEVR
ncbi:Na+/H+ antiporter subunit E [Flexivirga oryzae]|nr:Na+/H+ antiporter subunit E [Flexivirga oryzae]